MQAVIFGWKREILDEYLEDCEKVAKELTLNKFSIYTGGGGGFMLAGNKGCYNVDKKKSYGITVKSLYEKEGRCNKFYDKENLEICDTFSERKDKLMKDMDLYIFFPGGMGTLDEFTELFNLFKTGHLEKKPVILYGFKYWNSLKSWFEFNKILFPEIYIDGIVDTFNEFNSLYNKLFNNNQLVLKNLSSEDSKSSNEEIKQFVPFNKKKPNMFIDDDGINKLIDELFNDPIFKNEISSIIKNPDLRDPLIDNDDSDENDNIFNINKSDYEELKTSESESSEIEFIEIVIEDNENYLNDFDYDDNTNDTSESVEENSIDSDSSDNDSK